MKPFKLLKGFVGLFLLLTACQSHPKWDIQEISKPNPYSLVYTYTMAHGMAIGSLMGRPVTTAQFILLINMDRYTEINVISALHHPSRKNLKRADQIIQEFIQLINEQDNISL